LERKLLAGNIHLVERESVSSKARIGNPLNQHHYVSRSQEHDEMSNQMVEIAHEPLKKIVVRELVKYDTPQQLVNALSFIMKMGQPVLLTWADNVVFVSQPIPPSDMPEEYARGELYIASISYAPMTEFVHNVRSGNIEMPVIDVSRSPLSQELAKFLKSKLDHV